MTKEKNNNIYVGLIISGITIAIILGSITFGEIYLRKRLRKEWEHKGAIGLYTHDGIKFTKLEATLKLITNPFTIYKNLPNQKTAFGAINSLGFRGPEIMPEKKERKRIIVVGGSAAFGTSVENYDDTIESILGNINRDYEVINAGVVGFLSGQELAYIVTELIDYQPDIIIDYGGWNDLESQWTHERRFGKRKEEKELGYNANAYFTQIEKNLVDNYRNSNDIFCYFKHRINKSILLQKIINSIRKPTLENQHLSKSENIQKDERDDLYLRKIVSNYSNNLIKMNKFCCANNVRFLAVFQPELGSRINKTAADKFILSEWQFNYASYFPPLYKKFIEESEKILRKNNVSYLDMNSRPEFVNGKEALFADVVHTNRRGNQIVAIIINDYLRTNIAKTIK